MGRAEAHLRQAERLGLGFRASILDAQDARHWLRAGFNLDPGTIDRVCLKLNLLGLRLSFSKREGGQRQRSREERGDQVQGLDSNLLNAI